MRIVYDENDLGDFVEMVREISNLRPILIDKYLEDSVEIDVDAVSDGDNTVIGGIMEHIEEAGIHSGDSACVLPPHTLSDEIIDKIRQHTHVIAQEMRIKGLMNIQYAIKQDEIYILEVNPRASRTVPFASKATGVPLVKLAVRVMAGMKLQKPGITEEANIKHVAVKESVLPFSRFSGIDIILGPEMKSTGEVMGIDDTFGMAFYKAQMAAGQPLPLKGKVFISVKNSDKRSIVFIAKKLADMDFTIIATKGTAKVLNSNNIKAEIVGKIGEGDDRLLDYIKKGQIGFIINTPSGKHGHHDMKLVRSLAVTRGVACITTLQGAEAAVNSIETALKGSLKVKSIQEYLCKAAYTSLHT